MLLRLLPLSFEQGASHKDGESLSLSVHVCCVPLSGLKSLEEKMSRGARFSSRSCTTPKKCPERTDAPWALISGSTLARFSTSRSSTVPRASIYRYNIKTSGELPLCQTYTCILLEDSLEVEPCVCVCVFRCLKRPACRAPSWPRCSFLCRNPPW